jgi:hypothetical protein
MDKSTLLPTWLTVFLVLSLVVYRLLWAASSVGAARGGFSKLPKGVRRWLLGEHKDASN